MLFVLSQISLSKFSFKFLFFEIFFIPSEVRAALFIKTSNLLNFLKISSKNSFTSSSFSTFNFNLQNFLTFFFTSISAATKTFELFLIV